MIAPSLISLVVQPRLLVARAGNRKRDADGKKDEEGKKKSGVRTFILTP